MADPGALERAHLALPPGLHKAARVAREQYEGRGYYHRKARRAWAESVLRNPELAVQRYRVAIVLRAREILGRK